MMGSDQLMHAAAVWETLLRKKFRFTYGKSGRLREVLLSFTREDFFHLAGFHYLKDVSLPKAFSHRNTLRVCLKGEITEAHIRKSSKYLTHIEPRLKALCALDEVLMGDFTTYLFDRDKLPFHTEIDAAYLIEGGTTSVFLFVDQADADAYFCRSIFVRDRRSFAANQTPITLLKKEMITDSGVQVLFDQLKKNAASPFSAKGE